MSLPAGWEVEGEEEAPPAGALPEGWEIEGEEEEPAAEPKSKRTAGQAFLLNALDSASIVGLPRALAFGDTVKETFRGEGGDESFHDRYRRNLEKMAPIEEGMADDLGEHTAATIAGQLTTAFIPGPKLGLVRTGTGLGAKFARAAPNAAKLTQYAARGATLGALHGAAGGDADTLGGDIAGTAKDAVGGAAMGAAADVAGGAVGKVVEGVGNLAGRRLRADVLERAKSLIGKARQQKGEAGNALDRLEIMDTLGKAAAGAPPQLPRSPAKRLIDQYARNLQQPLRGARVGNAAKDFQQFERNIAKYGPRGVPRVDDAKAMALNQIKKEAGGVLRNMLIRTAGATIGSQVGGAAADVTGLDRRTAQIAGGLAGGLGSNYYLWRRTSAAVLTHPSVLERVARVVPGLGRAMQTGGKGMAETLLMHHIRKTGGNDVMQAVQEADDAGELVPDDDLPEGWEAEEAP